MISDGEETKIEHGSTVPPAAALDRPGWVTARSLPALYCRAGCSLRRTSRNTKYRPVAVLHRAYLLGYRARAVLSPSHHHHRIVVTPAFSIANLRGRCAVRQDTPLRVPRRDAPPTPRGTLVAPSLPPLRAGRAAATLRAAST